MKLPSVLLIAAVLAAALAPVARAAAPLALQPGEYETRVDPMDAADKGDLDRDCISADEAKDVVAYFKAEGKEESCTLTKATVTGSHFNGESLCKGGGDKKFTNMAVKTDLNFTPTGYAGTLVETGTGEDGKPFTKTMKISASRKGECPAPAAAPAPAPK